VGFERRFFEGLGFVVWFFWQVFGWFLEILVLDLDLKVLCKIKKAFLRL
jgi:hypothetical protein